MSQRFVISVASAQDGWHVTCDALGHTRALRRSARGFPLPPEAELPGLPDEVRALVAAPGGDGELDALHRRLTRRMPAQGDIPRYGQYLFFTLLGTALWTRMAAQAGRDTIELGLRWPTTSWELGRLLWETMHDAVAPLVRRDGAAATVTRLIPAPEASHGEPVRQVRMPLRVLFLIGSNLRDAKLRAGDEYLALLRRLEARGTALSSRLLVSATMDDITQAVRDYRPTVVHFIGHGDQEVIYLRPTPAQANAGDGAAGFPCTARELLGVLQGAGGELPQVLVLNACSTNGQPAYIHAQMAATAAEPFAVQMVRGGIPVVIGMAAEVADPACRMFTARFYEALLTAPATAAGQAPDSVLVDIAHAAAEGRRAALVGFHGYSHTVDWAFPGLLVDERVSATVALEHRSEAVQLQQALGKYCSNKPFCDRVELLRDCQEWLAGGKALRSVLMLIDKVEHLKDPSDADERYGKTRLIEQVAAHAIHQGYLPCKLSLSSRTQAPPKSSLELARALARAMRSARSAFQGLATLRQVTLLPPATQLESEKLGREDIDSVAAALRADLEKLHEDAAKLQRRPLVLLDDAHRFGEAASSLRVLIEEHAVFSAAGESIPLVITWSRRGEDKIAKEALKELGEQGYVRPVEFGEIEEAFSAYRQLMLHMQPPLVVSRTALPEQVKETLSLVHDELQGVPSRLETRQKQIVLALRVAQIYGAIERADGNPAPGGAAPLPADQMAALMGVG
ncbi:CHAT domain-containing protein [Sorangium sp. So ce1389]|uniref:CHAT domain-containing protein n=1 Tax=Sorangium sp. So ce1389 TaxID=3133336 RepID=UPI003F621EBA